jgi:hypothetical protein
MLKILKVATQSHMSFRQACLNSRSGGRWPYDGASGRPNPEV